MSGHSRTSLHLKSTSLFGFLVMNRDLVLEMARRDIRERYADRLLGAFWAVFSPLFLMGVYVVVFNFIFRVRQSDIAHLPGDYTTLLLSGLIPWLVIQAVLSRAVVSISGQPSLVRQVAFPTAVLPIKTILSEAPLIFTTTLVFLVYHLAIVGLPHWTALLLPVYWMVFGLYVLGLCLLLSSLAVFLRDLNEMIVMVFSIGLFLSPIMYIPGATVGWLEWVFYLNPFSYPIWVHRDIAFFGSITNPTAWVGFATLTGLFLFVGLSVYRRVENRFGDVL